MSEPEYEEDGVVAFDHEQDYDVLSARCWAVARLAEVYGGLDAKSDAAVRTQLLRLIEDVRVSVGAPRPPAACPTHVASMYEPSRPTNIVYEMQGGGGARVTLPHDALPGAAE